MAHRNRKKSGLATDNADSPFNPEAPEPEADWEVLDALPNTTRKLVAVPTHLLEVDPLSVRDAPPPPPGYRYTLDGRLVPLLDSRADLSEPSAQAVVCEIAEATGNLRAACDALGVTKNQLMKRIEEDPLFQEALEAACDRHRNKLYESAYRRAVHGHLVPIVGGPDKNEIVAYERRFSDSLTKEMLRRHFPEFREAAKSPNATFNKTTVNVGVGGGPTLEELRKLSREERGQLRALMAKAKGESVIPDDPDAQVVDAEAVEVVVPALPEGVS